MSFEKTWKKLNRDVNYSMRVDPQFIRYQNDIRLKGVVNLSRGHENKRIFDWKIGILNLLSLPYFMKTLATDTATQVGMQLDLINLTFFQR